MEYPLKSKLELTSMLPSGGTELVMMTATPKSVSIIACCVPKIAKCFISEPIKIHQDLAPELIAHNQALRWFYYFQNNKSFQNNTIMMRFVFALFLSLLLLLAVTTTTEGSALISRKDRFDRIQHLHATLHIDAARHPGEDIRTNVLLNMEGL
eukprot:scaffold1893_cov220-Amphora_coffeaeformis.AAC.22